MRGPDFKKTLVFLFVLLLASQSSASETLQVLMGERKLGIPLLSIAGCQYLPLDQVNQITGGRCQNLPGNRIQVLIGSTPFILKDGSARVVCGKEKTTLSCAPLFLNSGWAIPFDLFSFFLQRKYGDCVWWDKEGRWVRVGQVGYSIRHLRHCSYTDHTRVVLELIRPLVYSWREEKDRVCLRLEGGFLPPTIKEIPVRDGMVTGIKIRQGPDFGEVELFGLSPNREVKIFALKSPDRVVVDLYKRGGEVDKKELHSLASEEKAEVSAAAPQGSKVRLVIDPGHGGKDSGAVGPSGLKEKDVVLDIGLRLRDLVEKTLGMEVIMTRTDDTFIPLRDRAAIANTAKGDFFVSIHANASLHGRAEGFETFFLSHEASDSEARESAIRENEVIDLEGLNRRSADNLKIVLWDMAQNEYINQSSRLAEIIQNELDKIQKVANRGIKTAPFYVLMGAAMPAVLVEVAFINNPEGERSLSAEAYRQSLCEALFQAISEFKGYFEKEMGMLDGQDRADQGRALEKVKN
jgi:N-acetylmuramoyl-L-alanine amidase